VAELYRQADVFLFPSLGEGSALVTYEAMACSLPVVVTDNAGSLARPGIDGKLVEPADAEAIATALEQLRADPARRREMGEQAHARIRPYTWHSYGERLADTYAQVT
jgi:glycosyltransferase involved in cell wall biosynthesis